MTDRVGQLSTAPPPPPTYRTLAKGRYVLVRKLAEGGTATVHLGYDTEAQQWRAIKTLLPDYARRPALRHRFEREGATMRELQHPNIIRVFDAGADEQTAYLVMEFAEGGSVIDWVEKNGPMPPRMAAEVGLALCAGIQAAHEEGIIHRDIKPQNLLVDRDGICKVTDFGIAQVVQETRMTMTGTVMGTIGYMAPEQHESAKHADERADVYSIAATLYTLLHGEAATHLFMADDRDYEGIPSGLAEVVRKGAQYRREARYGTVAEMAKALRAAADDLPPDPVDVPPLIAPDLKLLDEVTPPSFTNTVRPNDEPGTGGPRSYPSIEPPSPVAASTARSTSADAEIVPVPPAPAPVTATPPSMLNRRSLSGEGAHRMRYVPVREFQQRQARLLQVGMVVVAVMLVLAFGAGFMVVLEGTTIDRLHKQQVIATQAMVDQFHEEVVLVDMLGPAVGPTAEAEMRKLFQQVERESDPAIRDAAASRLVTQLEQQLHELQKRNLSSEQYAVKRLQESLRRLDERREAYEVATNLLDEREGTWAGFVWTVMW